MISNKVSQQGHSASQTSRQIVSLAYFLVQRRDSKADQILEMSIVRFPLQTSQILPGLGKVHYFHFETSTPYLSNTCCLRGQRKPSISNQPSKLGALSSQTSCKKPDIHI